MKRIGVTANRTTLGLDDGTVDLRISEDGQRPVAVSQAQLKV
jgi:hypothetical protein